MNIQLIVNQINILKNIKILLLIFIFLFLLFNFNYNIFNFFDINWEFYLIKLYDINLISIILFSGLYIYIIIYSLILWVILIGILDLNK